MYVNETRIIYITTLYFKSKVVPKYINFILLQTSPIITFFFFFYFNEMMSLTTNTTEIRFNFVYYDNLKF